MRRPPRPVMPWAAHSSCEASFRDIGAFRKSRHERRMRKQRSSELELSSACSGRRMGGASVRRPAGFVNVAAGEATAVRLIYKEYQPLNSESPHSSPTEV